MALIDAACRLAAADPWLALVISGVLVGMILGVLWAWTEEWRRESW
jgi:F0F1-type ATP synthase assembly protein I